MMSLQLLIGFAALVVVIFLGIVFVLRALKGQTRSLHEIIGDETQHIEEVILSLHRLPETVENVGKEMKARLSTLSREQAELEILSRQTDMLSRQGSLNHELRLLEEKQKHLVKDQQEIRDQGRKIQADLDAEAKQQVYALEGHIFEILSGDLVEKIQRTYADRVGPIWQMLEAHNSDASSSRRSSLNDALEETRKAIEQFLQRYEQFSKELSKFVADHPVGQATVFEIPVWLVEVETEEEGIRREVVVPGHVEMEDGQFIGLPEAELASLQKRLERRADELLQAVSWKPMEERVRAEIITTLREHTENLMPKRVSPDVWKRMLGSLQTTGIGAGDQSHER